MIGDKTPIEFLFQFLVITQPAIWILLYDSKINFPVSSKAIVYTGLWAALMAVIGKQIQVGFYTTPILAQYCILIATSFYLYNQRKPVKESLCLAFLTVFLNSFYWELPLHITEVLTVGFYTGQLVQYWRLVPAVFLLSEFRFTRESLKLLLIGLVLSSSMILWKLTTPQAVMKTILIYGFTRFITLGILTKTVIEAEPKTKQ